MNKVSKASVLAGAVMIGGLLLSGAANAGVSVGVNIGVPAPVYVAPEPVYAPPPPPVVYAPPPPMYAQPVVVVGWHGDRYWDGRRYWERDDWYRHHGHGYGHDRDDDDQGHGHGHGRHGWH